jgi:hypothetical protein
LIIFHGNQYGLRSVMPGDDHYFVSNHPLQDAAEFFACVAVNESASTRSPCRFLN